MFIYSFIRWIILFSFFSFLSCKRTSYFFRNRSIKTKECFSKELKGECMFSFECMQNQGKSIGICIEHYYIGSCCYFNNTINLPNIQNENEVNSKKTNDLELDYENDNQINMTNKLSLDSNFYSKNQKKILNLFSNKGSTLSNITNILNTYSNSFNKITELKKNKTKSDLKPELIVSTNEKKLINTKNLLTSNDQNDKINKNNKNSSIINKISTEKISGNINLINIAKDELKRNLTKLQLKDELKQNLTKIISKDDFKNNSAKVIINDKNNNNLTKLELNSKSKQNSTKIKLPDEKKIIENDKNLKNDNPYNSTINKLIIQKNLTDLASSSLIKDKDSFQNNSSLDIQMSLNEIQFDKNSTKPIENLNENVNKSFLIESNSALSQSAIENFFNNRECGLQPLKPKGRVVGGRNAQFGEWPWQVLIKETTWLGLFIKTKCGGVLIDPKWVLTAAHCQPVFLGSLLVIVGEFNLNGNNESLKPVARAVKRMIIHRDYNPQTFENDIALLELITPLGIQPHVVPICIPNQNEDFVGQMGSVAGWGKLKYGGSVPNVLQVVRLPILENKICQEMYLEAGHVKKIRDTFLCAGYKHGGQDSCEGDSGGPLMIQRSNGQWVLLGTVSHGIKCAEPNLPGVYMRIFAYKKWIYNVLKYSTNNTSKKVVQRFRFQ